MEMTLLGAIDYLAIILFKEINVVIIEILSIVKLLVVK